MDTDELKKIWQQTDARLSALEAQTPNMAQSAIRRRHTVFDNLRNRYRRFIMVAMIMIFVMPLYAIKDFWPGEYDTFITVVFMAYFIMVAIMDYTIYRRLGSVDIDTMPVNEVNEIVKCCRRRHHQYMAVLIPIAIFLIGLIIWQSVDESYMLVGIFAGLVFGISVGIMAYRRFMEDYRSLYVD